MSDLHGINILNAQRHFLAFCPISRYNKLKTFMMLS